MSVLDTSLKTTRSTFFVCRASPASARRAPARRGSAPKGDEHLARCSRSPAARVRYVRRSAASSTSHGVLVSSATLPSVDASAGPVVGDWRPTSGRGRRRRRASAARSARIAVGVGITSIPYGRRRPPGLPRAAITSRRHAGVPQRRARRPCGPDERLPRKRTAVQAAPRVLPAETSTRLSGERPRRRAAGAAEPLRDLAVRRDAPRPTRLPPVSPSSGPISSTPRSSSVATLAPASRDAPTCAWFIAGATSIGPRCGERGLGEHVVRDARAQAWRACSPCRARRRAGRRASGAR